MSEKIDNIINYLRNNNKNYKKKLKEYNTLYKELNNTLSSKEMQKFDRILNLSNELSNDELEFALKNKKKNYNLM